MRTRMHVLYLLALGLGDERHLPGRRAPGIGVPRAAGGGHATDARRDPAPAVGLVHLPLRPALPPRLPAAAQLLLLHGPRQRLGRRPRDRRGREGELALRPEGAPGAPGRDARTAEGRAGREDRGLPRPRQSRRPQGAGGVSDATAGGARAFSSTRPGWSRGTASRSTSPSTIRRRRGTTRWPSSGRPSGSSPPTRSSCPMRLVKSPAEIEALRTAATASAKALRAGLSSAPPRTLAARSGRRRRLRLPRCRARRGRRSGHG